jgi:hypothetical protein
MKEYMISARLHTPADFGAAPHRSCFSNNGQTHLQHYCIWGGAGMRGSGHRKVQFTSISNYGRNP